MAHQPDGICLRYPENLGLHREINYEAAVNMLLRATQLAQNVPFSWGYVDKPAEGQVVLLYLQPAAPFPNDGIRFQEGENRYLITLANMRELEVHEVKYGFVPGSTDGNAWRARRRYRLHKGGHPNLVLVHYTRGQPAPILPALMNQPVRMYPLRPVSEPAVFVMGEKVGQKVYPGGGPVAASASGAMPPPGMGMPMNIHQQQAMVAQQNANMEALERRRGHDARRERGGSQGPRPPRLEEDDSGDETDQISTRTLAMSRYRRNHEIMHQVFNYAAFGDKTLPPQPSPYSIFSKTEIDEKAAKLQAEIDELNRKAEERRARREQDDKQTRSNYPPGNEYTHKDYFYTDIAASVEDEDKECPDVDLDEDEDLDVPATGVGPVEKGVGDEEILDERTMKKEPESSLEFPDSS
ncbi:hypothetical protein AX16_002238 [Volvariella volvacea WC 439]|nr:hypothetical protein AX16_002238 [Volvariella volvacea WC 439]